MKKFFILPLLLAAVVCLVFNCESAELLAEKSATDETQLSARFKAIDALDLAGIKVILNYDANKASYKSLQKSRATKSMMHVVNDKKPGQLIIVMASATGQKTPDFELFTITFELAGKKEQQLPLEIKLSGVEMMSAALTEIPCSPTTFRLH